MQSSVKNNEQSCQEEGHFWMQIETDWIRKMEPLLEEGRGSKRGDSIEMLSWGRIWSVRRKEGRRGDYTDFRKICCCSHRVR